jgi:putative Holliday junction resolvase
VRSGRRLAVDVGKVRIGVAVCDFHAILASGLVTIQRTDDISLAITTLREHIQEINPIEIYVGLPISMDGSHSASTEDALSFARVLEAETFAPVRLIDERLTTVVAASALRSSGRDSKSGRKIIDQIAATVILEQALEIEKHSGAIPGQPIEEFDE